MKRLHLYSGGTQSLIITIYSLPVENIFVHFMNSLIDLPLQMLTPESGGRMTNIVFEEKIFKLIKTQPQTL